MIRHHHRRRHAAGVYGYGYSVHQHDRTTEKKKILAQCYGMEAFEQDWMTRLHWIKIEVESKFKNA